MSTENQPARFKPLIILPPKAMSDRDRKLMNEAGYLVVVSKDPSAVRIHEPILSSYTPQEKAALSLCRKVIFSHAASTTWSGRELGHMLAEILMKGEPIAEVKKT